MDRRRATAVSVVHFVGMPGVVVVLVPWLLTGWQVGSTAPSLWPLRILGLVLTAVASVVLVRQFVRFVAEGAGTPAPPAPTSRLVVGGAYQRVRNPMYVAVTAAVLGQAMLLVQPVLFGYAAVLLLVMWLFVRWYEEPALRRQFGAQYDAYRAAVPGWWPRLRG